MSGPWTTAERIWAHTCFSEGDTVEEIADYADRSFFDVALKLGVYGPVDISRRWRRSGTRTRWVGRMLAEVVAARLDAGDSAATLARLAGVDPNSLRAAVARVTAKPAPIPISWKRAA